MNLKKVAMDDKCEFPGVEVEREYRDKNIFSVTVKFPDGSFFTVSKDGWSDISLLVKQPPKKVEKYKVTGRYYLINDFSKVFDDEFAAVDFKASCTDGVLNVEKIEVLSE